MRKQTRQLLVPCTAAVFTIGVSMMSWAATGWQEEDGTWRYYNASGEYATDTWKKSGDHWFWVDEDGEMLTDSLVEDDDNYYYVNESGAMVTNEWRELDNTDDDEDAADTCWYYLGPNGKAYKAPDSGKTTFKTINSKKYAFDEEGRMLYGWVDEESGRVTEEDAWKSGVYYLGANGDGAVRSNQWERMEVDDDENEDGSEPTARSCRIPPRQLTDASISLRKTATQYLTGIRQQAVPPLRPATCILTVRNNAGGRRGGSSRCRTRRSIPKDMTTGKSAGIMHKRTASW